MLKQLAFSAAILYSLDSLSNESRPSPVFQIDGKEKRILSEYLKKHREFSGQICRPGVEQKFWKLTKDFRGGGFFIPLNTDETLDKQTIGKNLNIISHKVKYLEGEYKHLKKIKSFKYDLTRVKKLQKDLSSLVKLKREYFEASSGKRKAIVTSKSRYAYIAFKTNLNKLFNSVRFLKPYRFPVDHFNLRAEYDKLKSREDVLGKRKMNDIYLFRKIVEDGAQNPNHTRTDLYVRSNINTIAIRLENNDDFISEDIRYDIESILKSYDRSLRMSKKKKLSRLKEWIDRTKRAEKFYKMLVAGKVEIEGQKSVTTEKLLSDRAKARYTLKQYVLEKEAKAYKFWSKESELMRAIFSIETILFNEVGRIDSQGAPERHDVSQVVINRRFSDKYNYIDEKTDLLENLKKLKIKTKNFPWLNTMFKQGEFSFTYFFIDGNLRIYCPDMSKLGKRLRRENLSIALDMLRAPNYEFDALRYFSRASMLGRINMAHLWNDYQPIEEAPGQRVYKSKGLDRLFKKGHYEFLYTFRDRKNDLYRVMRFGRKTYVKKEGSRDYYIYRNPHYFRYFKPLEL